MSDRTDRTVFKVIEGGEKSPVRPDALGKMAGSAGLPRMIESLRGPRRQHEVCPLCGWTADDFLKTHLLGCGLCHTVFGELIAASQAATEEPVSGG